MDTLETMEGLIVSALRHPRKRLKFSQDARMVQAPRSDSGCALRVDGSA